MKPATTSVIRLVPVMIRPWLLAALAVLGASCAGFRHADSGIETSLVNLSFGEATVWETTLRFTVRIENATPAPVRIDGAVHKIYLNGAYIGQGLSDADLEVPAFSSATQQFTAHLRNLTVAKRIRTMIESQRLDYRINSTLHLAPRQRALRLSNTGELDLREFHFENRAQ